MPTPGLNFSSTILDNQPSAPPDGPRVVTLAAASGTAIGLQADAVLVRLPAVVGVIPVGKVIDWVGTVRP